MKRFLKAMALVIIGGIIAAFAVANRQPVRLILDPLINRDVATFIEIPLYVLLFIALFAGLLMGACAVWIGQGRWRNAARARSKEAALWKREAETLKAGLHSASSSAPPAGTPRPLRSFS